MAPPLKAFVAFAEDPGLTLGAHMETSIGNSISGNLSFSSDLPKHCEAFSRCIYIHEVKISIYIK